MGELRVHAALAGEPQQVQAARARVTHAVEQRRVAEEFARFDHPVDARHVHQHHAAGADVEVSHFAVAHLPFRQPDGGARGLDQRVGVVAQEAVIGGLSGGGDGVAFDGRRVAPAIQHREDQRFRSRH